jgi:hypothetical protein
MEGTWDLGAGAEGPAGVGGAYQLGELLGHEILQHDRAEGDEVGRVSLSPQNIGLLIFRLVAAQALENGLATD